MRWRRRIESETYDNEVVEGVLGRDPQLAEVAARRGVGSCDHPRDGNVPRERAVGRGLGIAEAAGQAPDIIGPRAFIDLDERIGIEPPSRHGDRCAVGE